MYRANRSDEDDEHLAQVCNVLHEHATRAPQQRFLGALLHGYHFAIDRSNGDADASTQRLSDGTPLPNDERGTVSSIAWNDEDLFFTVPLNTKLFRPNGALRRSVLDGSQTRLKMRLVEALTQKLAAIARFDSFVLPPKPKEGERSSAYGLTATSAVLLQRALHEVHPWVLYELIGCSEQP